ncbi:MAG TPA: PxKF domain-containing protein [Nocardioides sp.]|nr:PxKF domain-containing protein [Nocardioides sp.]
MTSARLARRLATSLAAALVAGVALAGVPSPVLADADTTRATLATDAIPPEINGIYLTGGGPRNSYAPGAGVVDFFDPVPPSRDRNPTPVTVIGTSDPTALQGTALLTADLSGTPLGDLTLASLRLEDLPVEIPLSTIPVTRADGPRTWTELLAPTDLAGIPLQNVTWKQVWRLSPRPEALGQVTLDEVDFTGSVLADVPLSALVLGGAVVSSIEIPPQPGQDGSTPFVDRWCALLNAAQAGTCPDSELLLGDTLLEIGIKGAPLKNIPLKNIPLKNIDLETSPLKNIPLKNIVLDVAPLKNIPLKNIDLAASPLKNIPLKNIDFATSPLKNIPLKNIDFATSPLKNIPLKNIDLESSPLKNIPLKNIDFATSPLKNIPLKNIDLGVSGLDVLPLAAVDWATAPVGQVGLDQLDLTGPLLGPIPLSTTASADGIATCDAPTAWCDADPTVGEAAAAGAVRPGATLADVGASGFAGAATLADLLAARTAGSSLDPVLGDLRLDLVAGGFGIALGALLAALDEQAPEVLLGDLRLDLADDDTALLGWVFGFMVDADLFAAYLLGDVGTFTDADGRDVTLGDLGTWTTAAGVEITLGQLAQYLDDSVSLADLLLGLVPPSAFPFEDFPIDSLGLNQGGRRIATDSLGQRTQRTMGFVVLDNFGTEPTGPVTLELHLPAGAGFTGQLDPYNRDDLTVTDVRATELADGRLRIRAALPSLPVTDPVAGSSELVFFFDNPVRLGRETLDASLIAADGSVADTAETAMLLEENVEPNSPDEGGTAAPMPPDPTCSVPSPNCDPPDTEDIDAMVPGFIDRAGDVDWYVMRDVRAGARVAADLTNLPLDADVVLYGPSGIAISPTLFPDADEPLPGRLVEDAELGVGQAAASLSAQALADLQLDQGRVDPTSGTVVPPLTPLSVSLHRGTDAEAVGVVAPVDGDYVVAVTGYSAGTADEPYLLRTRVTNPPAAAACPARDFAHPTPSPSTAPTLPSDATALFLTHPGRLAATHGSPAAQDVDAALGALVEHLGDTPELGVRPVVVPLDAYPAVRDAYAAWDAAPCSVSAANDVAAQVTGVVRAVRDANPDLAYVTVVGGDDIVPMGRVPDLTRISNERDYAETFKTRNPISAAAAASYTLTDDVYGDTDPVDLGNGGSVFVPRLAVGRLVETPAEITALLDGYSSSSGSLDTSTGLVAGYDFLADGSAVVSNRLARPGRAVDDDLVDAPGTTSPWTRDDLLTRLLPADGPAPGVTSLNAHFDHTALLPSLGDAGGSDDLVSTSDVTAAADGRLAQKVLFTMGCHAGLAVPDAYLPGGAVDPLALDWAQALAAQEVSVYVANTGYGIGDTSAVAYSERLMGLYAKLLDGSVSAGQALSFAKQAYYGSLGAVGVYDLKILQQTTFYGLPFWGVGTTTPPPAPPPDPPPPDGLVVDTVTGVASVTLSVESSFDEVVTDRGRFWQVDGPDGPEDPQVTHYRPILPLTSRSVGVDGLVARGALVTSLDDREIAGVDPVLATPTIDLGASSPEVRVDDATWAPELATITTSQSPSGPTQNLVVVPGRFTGGSHGTGGRQRLYDEVGVQVLYAPRSDDDVAPPELVTSEGVVAGSSIGFRVAASDASGVRRVVVGFRDVDGDWRFTDLAPSSGGFVGSAALGRALAPGESVEYFVQAVDASGNVGLAWNKAAGFAARPAPPQSPGLTVVADVPVPASGWYTDDVTATATSSPVAPLDWRLDGGPWQLDRRAQLGPITITVGGEGVRLLDARGPDGQVSSLPVPLDRSDPIVIAPSAQAFERGQPTEDAFTCADAGSGIATCTSTPIDTSSLTAPGSQRAYTVTAVDRVGRTASTTVTYTVRAAADDVPPTITATVAPEPNPAGWHRTNPTVTFECSDARSGVADGACPPPRTVTSEGVQVVSGTVADRAGNESTTSVTVRLDRTAPVVRLTGVPDAPVCSTSDETSGVDTEAVLSRTTTRVDGVPTTTATCSGAVDVAGNTTPPLTRTYVAPLAFEGFEPPVDNAPIVNVGKAGRTYPLKFVLRDEQGALVTTVAAVARIRVVEVSCTTLDGAGDVLEEQVAGSSGLRWDAAAQQFVYTWRTPKEPGCFRVEVALADGSAARSALFRLTR